METLSSKKRVTAERGNIAAPEEEVNPDEPEMGGYNQRPKSLN